MLVPVLRESKMEEKQDDPAADKAARREYNRLCAAWRLMESRQRLARRGLSITLPGWVVIYAYGDLVRSVLDITASNVELGTLRGWWSACFWLWAWPFRSCAVRVQNAESRTTESHR